MVLTLIWSGDDGIGDDDADMINIFVNQQVKRNIFGKSCIVQVIL